MQHRLLSFFCAFLSLHLLIASSQAAPIGEPSAGIKQYTQQTQNQQMQLLAKLVNVNSGTNNRDGVHQVGELVRPQFEALGFQTRWHALPASMHHAGSLVAEHPGTKGPRLLLIGHLDTVFAPDSPFQRFSLSADKTQASGPGVIDDKGGVVVILTALEALQAVGGLQDARITVVLTGDEEHAASPVEVSRQVLRDAAANSDIALGFEFALAPDEAVVGRRGLDEWILKSEGKSSHSSTIFSAASGDGAIFELARVLEGMRASLGGFAGLTFNPGLVLGGQTVSEDEEGRGQAVGQKTIIAARALAHGDLRFMDTVQRDAARAAMQKVVAQSLPGTQSQLAWQSRVPAMAVTANNLTLLQWLSDASQQLGGAALHAIPAPQRGGADISHIADQVKASVDGLGPWGSGAHTTKETVNTASLPMAAARVALLMWKLQHMDTASLFASKK